MQQERVHQTVHKENHKQEVSSKILLSTCKHLTYANFDALDFISRSFLVADMGGLAQW